MLGKLLKYEFRATGRILLPILALMILAGIVAGFTIGPNAGTVTMILIFIFSGVAVASVVLTIIITVQRFQNNLLTDEGYLMFTLPVTTTKLILSKLIVAVVWGIVGTIAGIISAIALASQVIPWSEMGAFFSELPRLLAMLEWTDWVFAIEMIISSILSYSVFVLIIYTSLSVGQLPFASKHRKGFGLLTFFAIYIVYSICASILGNIMGDVELSLSIYTNMKIFGMTIGLVAALNCALFFVTRFILDKHLNLE